MMTDLKKIKLYHALIAVNILIWLAAFIIYHHYPISLSLALLAYSFGLRHALDADHIAAIDGATRKLLDSPKPQNGIGFFFSLGHSTIVIILSLIVAFTATSIREEFPNLSAYGSLLGSFFAVFFLLIFSITNGFILKNVAKKIKAYKKGEKPTVEIKTSGFLAKILSPIFRTVTKAWHMYFVGLLFGLGFDTATEVALLGMSAYAAAQNSSIWAIMLFPALFTAGMSLVDTISGMLISHACRWAYVNPARKLYYNLVITLFSFLTALLIGGYVLIDLLVEKLHLTGIWVSISHLGNYFELIGVVVIMMFVTAWVFSKLYYRRLEQKEV